LFSLSAARQGGAVLIVKTDEVSKRRREIHDRAGTKDVMPQASLEHVVLRRLKSNRALSLTEIPPMQRGRGVSSWRDLPWLLSSSAHVG
jgi:hypothetical protein